MDNALLIQLITSFIVGGAFIATLTFIAEQTNEKVSGIIRMLPSTAALGFFFLGWAVSAQKVAEIIPATLIPLGLVVFSSAIYIYTAGFIKKFVSSKLQQAILTTTISSLVWFIFAAPFALLRFSNLLIGIIGYAVLTIITHMLLQKDHGKERTTRPTYSLIQKICRAIFMGALVALVVFLGKTLNVFWGGIFTMFPAATFSALIFFHLHYPQKELFRFMKKAPIGSISLFVYAIAVMILFPKTGFIIGTLGAYILSLGSSLALIKLSD